MSRFSLCRPSLAAFAVCASQKSFFKAAKLLYISTPALIKQIEALEDGIGAKLFERSPRGLAFAPAGEALEADDEMLVSLTSPQPLGRGINVIAGVFDEAFLARYGCEGLELEQAPIGLAGALTSGFPAADSAEPLSLSALAGCRIYAPQRGLLEDFDRARPHCGERRARGACGLQLP